LFAGCWLLATGYWLLAFFKRLETFLIQLSRFSIKLQSFIIQEIRDPVTGKCNPARVAMCQQQVASGQ